MSCFRGTSRKYKKLKRSFPPLEKVRDASQEDGPRFLRPLSKDMTSPRCLVTSTATAEPSGMDVTIQLPVGQVWSVRTRDHAFSKPPTQDQGDSGQQPRRNAFTLLAEGARKEGVSKLPP